MLRPDDLVWVHDYQLMLLPGLIRRAVSRDAHRLLPSHPVSLLRSLPAVAAGLAEELSRVAGRQRPGLSHPRLYPAFSDSRAAHCPATNISWARLTLRDRVVKADTFPMGIDFERFAKAAATPETETPGRRTAAKCTGQKVIFSVDRLDYTKGLIDRLKGYDLFPEAESEWRGKVVFVVSVAPSRTGVESYQAMKIGTGTNRRPDRGRLWKRRIGRR